MNKNNMKNTVSTLSVLLMLLVFSVAVIPAILFGASFYKSLGERDHATFEDRTAVQYIMTKLRQSDGVISIGDFGGENALIISEQIEGLEYSTRIYCCDGWLMELFALSEGEFEPIDGEKLMPIASFKAEYNGGLFDFSFVYENGNKRSFSFSPRVLNDGAGGAKE